MANYLFAYTGGESMPEGDAEREALMAAWGQWFQSLGAAVVDVGNPVGASASVGANGTGDGAPSGLSGYSIVAADSLTAASELAKGCPILGRSGKVDVYETLSVM